MKHTVRPIFAMLVLLMISACAATPGKVSQTTQVASLNLRDGVALKGYDAVSYFTEGAPVPGDPSIRYQWQQATWLFSTPAHRKAFAADPAHYAPQFGGYCAFAVSRGTTADADPAQWAVVNDKLYVNNNAFAKKLWDHDRPASIAAGNVNWPLIPKFFEQEPAPVASPTASQPRP